MDVDNMDVDDALSTKEAQRRLMKKYNIFFDGPVNLSNLSRFPPNLGTYFQHVKQLGRTTYKDHCTNISADFHHHPWRHQVRKRADRIAHIAKRCLNTRQNESGWRLNVEHEIMARFSVEVACKSCRGRLWRSEQEVIWQGTNNPTSPSLKDRQDSRKACGCGSSALDNTAYDDGINALFDNKADEMIKYPKGLQRELPKRDRPDRVYGLRVTERFDRLLSLTPENRLVTSPFKMEGEPIIFPYLVLEAKSEKSADGFQVIQVQTAFAIRELLCIQDGLAEAVENPSTWDGGPLVWFLSCKGEQWRVLAAYIERVHSVKTYRVARLWAGSVDDQDDALQLLLILDYIVDWARDVYREAVAQSLRKLATHDSRSLGCDPDILSLAGTARQWDLQESNTASGKIKVANFNDPLRILDSKNAVFRDARFIRTNFMALYLTPNNFSEFVLSFPSDRQARMAASELVTGLLGCLRVKKHMLDSLEATWSDTERYGADMYPPDEPFLVTISAISFLSMHWEQTRELSYLAVAESLVDDLFVVAGLAVQRPFLLQRIPTVTSLALFQELLQRGVSDTLSACASRECMYTDCFNVSDDLYLHAFAWQALPRENSNISRVPVIVRKTSASPARDRVRLLYLQNKRGRNEPTHSFFRLSRQVDELGPRQELSRRPATQSLHAWTTASQIPRLHSEDIIFAQCANCNKIGLEPDICIFIMDPQVAMLGLSAAKLRQAAWYLNVRKDDTPLWNAQQVDTNFPPIFTINLDNIATHLQSTSCHVSSAPAQSCPSDATGSAEAGKTTTLWNLLTKEGIVYDSLSQFKCIDGLPYRRLNVRASDENETWMAPFRRTARLMGESEIDMLDDEDSSREISDDSDYTTSSLWFLRDGFPEISTL